MYQTHNTLWITEDKLVLVNSPEKNKLRELDLRIKAAKKSGENDIKFTDPHAGAHLAWRMVLELVVGMVIGFAVGYGLDVAFQTTPVFLLLFVLLGFAAGIKTMLDSAKQMQNRNSAEAVIGKKD